ncbi:hypothetical protein JCM10213_008804 [Rhodosporidiobolus nylandii]
MASTSAFSSPLGPLHHAHPSTAPAHTLSLPSLFRSTKKSDSSSSSRSAKHTKKLHISSPVLISTSNGGLPDSTPVYTLSAPASSRYSSPPPPYSRSSFPNLDDENDIPEVVEADEPITALQEKQLLAKEVVEARMQSLDGERREQQARELASVDVAIARELKKLGF